MLVVFVRSAGTIFDFARAEQITPDKFVVDIYGKQWWWEIHYPNIPGAKEGEPLVTANEVRLPQGADVVFNLRSNNVIHSFSVPRLSGKTDVVPGHDNKLQFVASEVGEYWGECAEFCGAAHAWMRFKVLVVPPEEFLAWTDAWHTPPAFDANAATADVHEAPAAFAACMVCHRITGTPAQIAQIGIGADPKSQGAGPDLTLLGCRDFIGAGVLKNTPEDLKTWLMHTTEVKEGAYMPNYVADGVINEAQVDELVQYLGSLVPEGGCPSDNLRGPTSD
jgi:cytochrome c oxidase subunit 2